MPQPRCRRPARRRRPIRPYFGTHGTDLSGIIAFIGTVGGFLTWGLIGVFLGPVLTAVIYEMLLAWMAADAEGT